MNLFKKKNYIPLGKTAQYNRHARAEEDYSDSPIIPNGLWVKCRHCSSTIYKKEMDEFQICPKCGGHFRIGARDRLNITCDEGSFEEFDADMTAKNPMGYPDYEKVLEKAREKSGLKDGVVTGKCTIGGYKAIIAVMDSNFMMGSMGSVVGEKITRAIEKSTEMKLPMIIFTTSGGARMQEGIISLMQMAKTSAAVRKHSDAGLLYVSVITDPTTGGVSASFANLGDIILAEPKSILGFAGRRVIEGTINEKLPPDFQSAEFQMEHGFVDKIVDRRNMKSTLVTILKLHCPKEVD
ncbi:MAG: acetyl-CoA carboxylase, carboxyltransferase subunit beta [Clostridia bacterium]|jgi:acetyl-CoA carboxylase carboxyl transferase subunit beta|nr:acetyl-CoA carboxylase, carboxyltransferase subunit beta [Clostridia bacterium]MCI2000021.1 acetyl-CoA carboxylase, carboxyltransferase subunit beta [Clostridia bacterium]MCI2014445.1 acetyl-CoA carboxylase, carboxyltransferase subunit beta [Clostridia bacterium]